MGCFDSYGNKKSHPNGWLLYNILVKIFCYFKEAEIVSYLAFNASSLFNPAFIVL